jgi:hypothetical protein
LRLLVYYLSFVLKKQALTQKATGLVKKLKDPAGEKFAEKKVILS